MPSIEQLTKLLAAEPGDAFLLYGLAQEYAKAGRTADAVDYFDRCLAVDPAYCYAFYHKGRALADAGQVARAVQAVKDGMVAAKKAADSHAFSELSSLLDEIEED
jgi:predicted Zn-dependent protease